MNKIARTFLIAIALLILGFALLIVDNLPKPERYMAQEEQDVVDGLGEAEPADETVCGVSQPAEAAEQYDGDERSARHGAVRAGALLDGGAGTAD